MRAERSFQFERKESTDNVARGLNSGGKFEAFLASVDLDVSLIVIYESLQMLVFFRGQKIHSCSLLVTALFWLGKS